MLPGLRSPTGQLYVTAGPPSASDPRLSGFALKPTGEVYVAGGAAPWSPADLFAGGAQGAWYDPSDLSTLFQDSAGTIPVTADGQPVGLMLDKSQGLVLGPDLVTNGNFSNGITGWTVEFGNASVIGGELVLSESEGAVRVNQTLNGGTSGWYKITLDVSVVGGADADARIFLNNVALLRPQNATKTTVTFYGTGPANAQLSFSCTRGNVTYSMTVDNVVVSNIAGNHASQVNAAACPLYKTDGTYYWLQFDGVDDFLRTAIFPIDGLSGDTFVGMLTPANNIAVWLTDQPGSGFWAVMQSGDTQSPTGVVCGTPGYRVDGVDLVAPTRTSLFAAATGGKSVVTTKGLVFGLATPTGLSISGYTGFLISGNIYSIIVRGAIGTPQEITDTETWINSKTGAY